MKRAKTATNQNGANIPQLGSDCCLTTVKAVNILQEKMQREKSVKVKEVIASLCKLLSGLGVESIPTAEAFRRAKFNRKDAVRSTWVAIVVS